MCWLAAVASKPLPSASSSFATAPWYDAGVFDSSTAPAYDNEFATSARSATPSPSYDNDLFGVSVLDREPPNGKQTAHPRFDTAPRMELESKETHQSLLIHHFINPVAPHLPSAKDAMAEMDAATDASDPVMLDASSSLDPYSFALLQLPAEVVDAPNHIVPLKGNKQTLHL
jgi:hypothetical protein